MQVKEYSHPTIADGNAAAAVAPRAAYVAASLVHLGNVRSLTLGTSNKSGETARRNL